MDFVEGQSGPLTLDSAAAVVKDLAKTVDAAHGFNILHRELKPDNVIVRDLELADLVIVDFGLSFNEEESPDESLTKHGDQIRNRSLLP